MKQNLEIILFCLFADDTQSAILKAGIKPLSERRDGSSYRSLWSNLYPVCPLAVCGNGFPNAKEFDMQFSQLWKSASFDPLRIEPAIQTNGFRQYRPAVQTGIAAIYTEWKQYRPLLSQCPSCTDLFFGAAPHFCVSGISTIGIQSILQCHVFYTATLTLTASVAESSNNQLSYPTAYSRWSIGTPHWYTIPKQKNN